MFVVQCAVALVLWLAAGYICFKRAFARREKWMGAPRGIRILAATALLIASIALLFGGLVLAMGQTNAHGGALSLFAWGAVIGTGAFFVSAQTISTALLMTLIESEQVTPHPAQASQGKNQSNPS